jgi:hypothetical protein
MGLFTDPLVLVDEDTNNRTFNFRAQLTEQNAIVGEYIEPAASIAAGSKLVVKHTTSASGLKRHLLQRVETFDLTADPTDGSEAVVVNLTISHHKLATDTQVQNQLTLIKDALSETNFLENFMRELI